MRLPTPPRVICAATKPCYANAGAVPAVVYDYVNDLFRPLRSDPVILLTKVVPKTPSTCSLKAMGDGAPVGLLADTPQKHPELMSWFSLTLVNLVLGTGSLFCHLIREIGVATPHNREGTNSPSWTMFFKILWRLSANIESAEGAPQRYSLFSLKLWLAGQKSDCDAVLKVVQLFVTVLVNGQGNAVSLSCA